MMDGELKNALDSAFSETGNGVVVGVCIVAPGEYVAYVQDLDGMFDIGVSGDDPLIALRAIGKRYQDKINAWKKGA